MKDERMNKQKAAVCLSVCLSVTHNLIRSDPDPAQLGCIGLGVAGVAWLAGWLASLIFSCSSTV